MIKFRGKNILNGKWEYGYYYKKGRKHYIYSKDEVEVKRNTIGQYTNTKDINGTDIYDGDIVLGYDIEIILGGKFMQTKEFKAQHSSSYVVKYYDGSYILIPENNYKNKVYDGYILNSSVTTMARKLKVKGNIYDKKRE